MSSIPLTPLPVDDILPELFDALESQHAVVVQAPPGSGKTTRIPPAILDYGLAGEGRVVVLDPRRIAARAACRRIAAERGWREGAWATRCDSTDAGEMRRGCCS